MRKLRFPLMWKLQKSDAYFASSHNRKTGTRYFLLLEPENHTKWNSGFQMLNNRQHRIMFYERRETKSLVPLPSWRVSSEWREDKMVRLCTAMHPTGSSCINRKLQRSPQGLSIHLGICILAYCIQIHIQTYMRIYVRDGVWGGKCHRKEYVEWFPELTQGQE